MRPTWGAVFLVLAACGDEGPGGGEDTGACEREAAYWSRCASELCPTLDEAPSADVYASECETVISDRVLFTASEQSQYEQCTECLFAALGDACLQSNVARDNAMDSCTSLGLCDEPLYESVKNRLQGALASDDCPASG